MNGNCTIVQFFTFCKIETVNKVNTKVHLIIPVTSLGGLTDAEVIRLRTKLTAIINKEDCLFLDVDV
ncbi:MAG: hypothetical protein K5873_06870 [Treponema sp.]|nr:hypothetical protein [Treponema sp.]